jgi:hypothetical protein
MASLADSVGRLTTSTLCDAAVDNDLAIRQIGEMTQQDIALGEVFPRYNDSQRSHRFLCLVRPVNPERLLRTPPTLSTCDWPEVKPLVADALAPDQPGCRT